MKDQALSERAAITHWDKSCSERRDCDEMTEVGHPSSKKAYRQGTFAAIRTAFYSASRHIRFVRTPTLYLGVVLVKKASLQAL
jgi:hypothetical protein